MKWFKKITTPDMIWIPGRYIWHAHHIGLATLLFIIGNFFTGSIWLPIIICSGFIGKKGFEPPSKNQTKWRFIKDAFTDFNQYCIVWVLHFQHTEPIIAAIILCWIVGIYILTIDEAYP